MSPAQEYWNNWNTGLLNTFWDFFGILWNIRCFLMFSPKSTCTWYQQVHSKMLYTMHLQIALQGAFQIIVHVALQHVLQTALQSALHDAVNSALQHASQTALQIL